MLPTLATVALICMAIFWHFATKAAYRDGIRAGFYDAHLEPVRDAIQDDPRYQDDLNVDHSKGRTGFTPLMRDRAARLGPRFVVAVDDDGFIHSLFEPCSVVGNIVNAKTDLRPLASVSVTGLLVDRHDDKLVIGVRP